MAHRNSKAYERVYLGIAVVVTGVWTVATLAQVVDPRRVVPTYVNLVMLSVAGAFFGASIVATRRSERKNGNGNGNGS